MAIIQDKEPNGLRLGSVQNLYQESMVQENYMADMIKAYGLDIRYYKIKSPYPEVFKSILDSRMLGIHAYGEDYTPEFYDFVPMIAYIKWESDGIVLNSYGIQPDSSITMYLNQTDFAISMAKHLSKWQSYKVVGDSEFILDFDNDQDLIANRDNIKMVFHTDLFDGSLQALLDDHTLNQLLVHNSCSNNPCDLKEKPIVIPCRVLEHGDLKIDTGRINPLLYKGDHYDPFESKLVECQLHLEVVSILKDVHGCIRIMGGIRGEVIYFDTEVVSKYIEKIGPEVGDLIDIPVPGDVGSNGVYKQKYEIVHIEETKTNENFMNPFLRKYIYEISLRAYVASGQEEPNGPSQAQVELKDKLDLINTAAEDAVKKVSLYEDDEENVYGGYQKINKRGNPSVQRDANKSTINDFDPPDAKAKAKVRKTSKPLFIFKAQKMVLSLVDDPKQNNAYLKLAPLKKSTKIDKDTNYLDYLRANDDNFCLVNDRRVYDDNLGIVNDIQAYLLASRFKQPEFDDDTFCIKPMSIRLKHEVYGQKNGWQDQPFKLADCEEEQTFLGLNLQDLIGNNTTPKQDSASENRLTFPYTRTYLEVEYDRITDEKTPTITTKEIWTCFVVLEGDSEKTHLPICSYILTPNA